jgi:surface carbohydrate biosynthesis protein
MGKRARPPPEALALPWTLEFTLQDARPPLLIPVENQVREIDAKLLLALVAAERGFPVILGSRATLHRDAASLPRGVYLAKSFRSLSVRMFRIYRDLGSRIAAWDEEALVRTPNREFWYRRRLSKEALEMVDVFFAWGADDADTFGSFPDWPGTTIHTTGNPRIDMMRPELRGYFDEDVAALRRRYGDFVLVNTNFGLVNHYVGKMTGAPPVPPGSNRPEDLEVAEGLVSHRRELFEGFKEMVGSLAESRPKTTIIVRPHPIENPAIWNQIAARYANVHALNEGNVLPWLLASKLLIQNGCTTGVEAFVLGVPSIAYQSVVSERFDGDLPNALSARAFDLDQLNSQIDAVLEGTPLPDGEERRKRAQQHITSLEGPLASDRIVDVLADLYPAGALPVRPQPLRFATAWLHSEARALVKRARAQIPGNRNSADYQRHRFPGVTLEILRERTDRLARLLNRFDKIRIQQRAEDIFEIRSS